MTESWLRELQSNEDLLKSHHLMGLFFSRYKANGIDGRPAAWQKLINFTYWQELDWLAREICGRFPVTLLKGASLLEEIYSDFSERLLSDVDLLVDCDFFPQLHEILLRRGFKTWDEKKWYGNQHKVNFERTTPTGIVLVIEVHVELFYGSSAVQWRREPHLLKGLYRLEPTDQLFHLVNHLSYQHNLTQLNWLYDVLFFYEKYKTQISSQRLEELCREHGMYSSTWTVIYILGLSKDSTFHEIGRAVPLWKKSLIKNVVSRRYLFYPQKNYIHYLLVKILMRDRLWQVARLSLGRLLWT